MFYIFGKLQHQGKIWQKLGAILMDRFGVMIFCFRVWSTSDFDLRVFHMHTKLLYRNTNSFGPFESEKHKKKPIVFIQL